MGSGIPGPHNWSATDNNTILTAPLGGHPQMVRWSVSVVLTPAGWVGRVDNHLTQKTQHCTVEPQAQEAYAMIEGVLDAKREKEINALASKVLEQFNELDLTDLGLTREDLRLLIEEGLSDGTLLEEHYQEEEWTIPATRASSTPRRSVRRW
jgi:hypothetical protein